MTIRLKNSEALQFERFVSFRNSKRSDCVKVQVREIKEGGKLALLAHLRVALTSSCTEARGSIMGEMPSGAACEGPGGVSSNTTFSLSLSLSR